MRPKIVWWHNVLCIFGKFICKTKNCWHFQNFHQKPPIICLWCLETYTKQIRGREHNFDKEYDFSNTLLAIGQTSGRLFSISGKLHSISESNRVQLIIIITDKTPFKTCLNMFFLHFGQSGARICITSV